MNESSGRATDPSSPLVERTIAGYLAAISSRQPTPGGGSAVGVAAGLAAALGEKVAALSAGSGDQADALRAAAGGLAGLRGTVLALAEADEAAYAGYRAASALPQTSEREREDRRVALARALRSATDTPVRLAEACLELLRTTRAVALAGKASLRSDTEIAVLLSEAALRGALVTARGNLPGLADADRTVLARRIDELDEAATAARDAALTALDGTTKTEGGQAKRDDS